MRELRLQNMTPEVYCKQSRDFQVLCRAFDLILSGIKFDTDTIEKLTDTSSCRESFLQLLQTKLGFFTNHKFNSETLRYILNAFPYLIKNKGSLKAIEGAIYAFSKSIGITPDVRIWYTYTDIVQDYYTIKNNSIIIGIEGKIQDVDILIELFKYILPVGIHYYFFFFTKENSEELILMYDRARLIYISDTANSKLRKYNEFSYSSVSSTTNKSSIAGSAIAGYAVASKGSDIYMNGLNDLVGSIGTLGLISNSNRQVNRKLDSKLDVSNWDKSEDEERGYEIIDDDGEDDDYGSISPLI